MKKPLISLFVITALVTPGVAFADEASGRVKTVNSWSVTLQDGTFYVFNDSSKIKDLKPGEEVSVSYQETPEENMGVSIKRK